MRGTESRGGNVTHKGNSRRNRNGSNEEREIIFERRKRRTLFLFLVDILVGYRNREKIYRDHCCDWWGRKSGWWRRGGEQISNEVVGAREVDKFCRE